MNVVVFGGTGSTGRLVVESALSAGHVVTAFVRDIKRMPLTHPKLRIVKGDAMDPASVASAGMRSSARWGQYLRRKVTGVGASPVSRFARWGPGTFWLPWLQAGAGSSSKVR